MSDILYLKIDRNVVVHKPEITLGDIASLTCTNGNITNKLKTLKVHTFHKSEHQMKNKKQLAVFSILKIVELIGKEYPKLQVENLGEKDFLLEYVPKEPSRGIEIVKAGLVCILIFFGSAFTIMTFNNDVGVADVFSKFYEQIMGRKSSGFTALEISYAIGLAFGIMVFFNHIGHKKVTHDPTPIQVQMRKYEQDVDTTFIENASRKGTSIDVD